MRPNDQRQSSSEKDGSKMSEKAHRYSARRSSSGPSRNQKSGKSSSNENSKEEMTENNHQAVNIQVIPDGDEKTEDVTTVSEDAQKLLEVERSQALEAQESAKERVNARKAMREKNIAALDHRPEESFFKGLDSSMKKNTSFVKKLKNISEQQRESLIQEFNGLNLTKFIQEAVNSIVEAKVKVADVGCVAHLCSLFHQRYVEFTPLLKTLMEKSFDNINCKDDEKAGNVPKLRSSLRLFAELVLDGIFSNIDESVQILQNIISSLIHSDKTSHIYAPVVLTFVRHCGGDVIGIISRKQRMWKEKFNMEFVQYNVIPQNYKRIFKDLLKEYYDSMAVHLTKDHKSLQNRDRQNRQTIGLKGELSAERKESYEKAQKTYEKLLANTSSLAELLDEELPDLPEEQIEEKVESGTINIFTPVRGNEYDTENGLWEDEDTRTFYENLKDLKSFVPQILFKEKDTKPSKDNKRDQRGKRKLRNDLNLDDDYMDDFSDDEIDENYEKDILGDENEESESSSGSSSGVSMTQIVEKYLQDLVTCVNRDFIDQAAETFIMKMNRKDNRKKLIRTLFTVSRTRLDLLPFYGRLVATLAPCLPDIAQDLVFLLKGDFRFHLRKKHQINLESKVKTVRFIGELTKFKVCPKAETLHCLKMLLEDFTHHNIEMTCHLLETCGRFLYRSPESHPRMKNLLEQMMRKKAVQALDSRLSTMIENAYYYCNPPDRQKVQVKERPPMHEYMRRLLYKDLSKTTTEKVLRQMRKLPWDESGIKNYAVKCLTKIWNVKYSNIHCAANMLSGLCEYHDDLGVYVVDEVIEYIRLGMEINIPKFNQQRVSMVKYLGELFNYQLVETDVIFATLYSLITFGSSADSSLSELDPPEHLFRIRLVCVLLDTCGQYFDRGSSRKKLDCFLIYFQSYIWRKKESGFWSDAYPFPRDVDYMIADTIESLRPKLNVYGTAEEAKKAVDELEKELQDKISNILMSENASKPESIPKSNIDPTLVPLPGSGLSGASLGESACSVSPSQRSHSSSGEEDAYESDYISGDEYIEDQIDDNGVNIFEMEADENVRLREGPKLMESSDDYEFKSAFDKMVNDSFQGRLTEAMKVDIAIPMHLKGKGKKQPIEENPDSVKFVLMLKKGNKQQFRDLNIPVTENLAANIRDKQVAEREEHEEMKRLVLGYNQRQEEEAFNEMLASTHPTRPSFHSQHSSRGHRRGQQRLRSRDHDPNFFHSTNRHAKR